MKKRHTKEDIQKLKTGIGWTGLLDGEATVPRKLSVFIMNSCIGGRIIAFNHTTGQGSLCIVEQGGRLFYTDSQETEVRLS